MPVGCAITSAKWCIFLAACPSLCWEGPARVGCDRTPKKPGLGVRVRVHNPGLGQVHLVARNMDGYSIYIHHSYTILLCTVGAPQMYTCAINQQCCCHLGVLAWPSSSFLHCTEAGLHYIYIQLLVLCVSLTVNNVMRHSKTKRTQCQAPVYQCLALRSLCAHIRHLCQEWWYIISAVMCSCEGAVQL